MTRDPAAVDAVAVLLALEAAHVLEVVDLDLQDLYGPPSPGAAP